MYCVAARCATGIVKHTNSFSGKIQRGLFYNGVGLQAYAPGQRCVWRLTFTRKVKITFRFEILALAFDDLDFVTITKPMNVVVKKLTRMGKNIVVTTTGKDFTVKFVTFGDRSPYPISAGFVMHYKGKQLLGSNTEPLPNTTTEGALFHLLGTSAVSTKDSSRFKSFSSHVRMSRGESLTTDGEDDTILHAMLNPHNVFLGIAAV